MNLIYSVKLYFLNNYFTYENLFLNICLPAYHYTNRIAHEQGIPDSKFNQRNSQALLRPKTKAQSLLGKQGSMSSKLLKTDHNDYFLYE